MIYLEIEEVGFYEVLVGIILPLGAVFLLE